MVSSASKPPIKKNTMTTASKKQLSSNLKAINFATVMWVVTILLTVPLLLWLQAASFVIIPLIFIFGICFVITAYRSTAKRDRTIVKRRIANGVLITTIVLIIYWLVIIPILIILFANSMSGGILFLLIYMFGIPIAIVLLALALTFRSRAYNKPKLQF